MGVQLAIASTIATNIRLENHVGLVNLIVDEAPRLLISFRKFPQRISTRD